MNDATGGALTAKDLERESGSRILGNRIWRIDDVAEYTGYKVGTLYNLTSKNLIPHRKKRGKLFFLPFEIQNWIEEGDLG